jgi:F0F1-type ATP synthase membrane subunit c/vacuolar-type H+-ATPase subunit K
VTGGKLTPQRVHLTVRMMQGAMLFSIVLYAFVAETVLKQRTEEQEPASILPLLIWPALFCAVGAIVIRLKYLEAAQDAVRSGPANNAALGKLQSLHIVMFAFGEAVALFGFVWRFLGGDLTGAIVFYVAGAALILFGSPSRLD